MSNIVTFNKMLKEYFASGFLEGKDKIKYRLIVKYWDKISDRLKKEHEELIEIGDQACIDYMRTVLSSKNTIYDMMRKKDE